MDDLFIAAAQSSPEIAFNATANTLSISGKSYMENTAQFYAPVFSWLRAYLGAAKGQKIMVTVALVYFNSSSYKVYMNLFDMLEESVKVHGNKIIINWRYDTANEMVLDYGEEFQTDLRLVQFNLVEFS